MSTVLMNIYLNSHYITHSLSTLSKSPFANFFPNYHVSSREHIHTFTESGNLFVIFCHWPMFSKGRLSGTVNTCV